MLESLTKEKSIATFAIVSLVAGVLFFNLTDAGITGNVIGNSFTYKPLGIIGILLIGCSLILSYHLVKKR